MLKLLIINDFMISADWHNICLNKDEFDGYFTRFFKQGGENRRRTMYEGKGRVVRRGDRPQAGGGGRPSGLSSIDI
jgi:hypothetical protein